LVRIISKGFQIFLRFEPQFAVIWQHNLAGGAPKQITNFESGQIFDFAWSHDGKQLAMTRGSENSDVTLISNLR